MSQQPFEEENWPKIMTQIYEGMTVYDCDGDKIGTVRKVYLGAVSESQDERGLGTATVATPEPEETSLIDDFFNAYSALQPVPDPVRQRLLRQGFIRINTSGLLTADRYAMPDQIEGVSGDEVSLRVSYDVLMKR